MLDAESPLPPPLRHAFAERIRARLGLSFHSTRAHVLDLGIRKASTSLALTPGSLLTRLDHDDVAWDALTRCLVVGETYFFRDAAHFQPIRERLARDREPLRLWSAGCASGEEPYTMAILALEIRGQPADEVAIWGSDVNPEFLARAGAAVYRPWSLRGVPPATVGRWFRPTPEGAELLPAARERVRFFRCNLLRPDDAWPRDIDVIMCRNVMVYFQPDEAAQVLANLRDHLRADGFIVPGPTDPLCDVPGLSKSWEAGMLVYHRAPHEPAPPPPLPLAMPRLPAAPRPAKRLSPPRAAMPIAAPELASVSTPAVGASPAVAIGAAELLAICRAHADRGEIARAREALDHAEARFPFEPEVYVVRALVSQHQSRHAEAVRQAGQALLLDRTLAYPNVLRASSWAALGQRARARSALERARRALADRPTDAEVPCSGGMTVAELLQACRSLARGLDGGPQG